MHRPDLLLVVFATMVSWIPAAPGAAQCLDVDVVVPPGTYGPNDLVQVSVVVECPGPETCGPCVIGLWLDSVCGGSSLGVVNVGPVSPGIQLSLGVSVLLPADISPGSHSVCASPSCPGCFSICATSCDFCPCSDLVIVVPDPCPSDVDADGQVGVEDLVAVILAWDSSDPQADVNGDGAVDVGDLVEVIMDWGPCG